MISLYGIVEGSGHILNRLGAGSSGVVYRIGNNKVRKTFRLESKYNNITKEKSIVEDWSRIKRGLKVIPYITDVNNEGYTMDAFVTPCDEGKLIEKVLWKCLYSPYRKDWDKNKIQKAVDLVGQESTDWVMGWLDDYCDDVKMILGDKRISDDIRSANIGKTRDGRVVCFDWFSVY